MDLTRNKDAQHQDVAGAVGRLRGDPNGNYSIVREEAATLIESLSKALSEAEAERDRLSKRIDLLAVGFNVPDGGRYIADWQTKITKFKSAESRLAEAMNHLRAMHRYASRSEAGPEIAAARRFLNAGKE